MILIIKFVRCQFLRTTYGAIGCQKANSTVSSCEIGLANFYSFHFVGTNFFVVEVFLPSHCRTLELYRINHCLFSLLL